MKNASRTRRQAAKPISAFDALVQKVRNCLPQHHELHRALAGKEIPQALELLDSLRAMGGQKLYLFADRTKEIAANLHTPRGRLLASMRQTQVAKDLYLQLQKLEDDDSSPEP